MLVHMLTTTDVTIGGFKWKGEFTAIDLIAASTNALNGALLSRRPDHYRNFTVVGVLIMALLCGIGGGVTRDVLVNQVPSALVNPAYILLCLGAGVIGYNLAFAKGQLFREGLFQFMTAFSLPWMAIAGAQKAEQVHLPLLPALLLAVVGATAGRYYVDITSGVAPKQFVRGEWFVPIALMTAAVWIFLDWLGLNAWASTGIAFVIGFAVRVVALYRGWEEPLAKEPTGVYEHSDGRPLLGRKIRGKSERELRDLGLVVENPEVV